MNVDVSNLLMTRETELAILVERYAMDNGIWLPKSQIDYMLKKEKTPEGRVIDIKIPEWLAKKNKLDYE